MNGSTKIHQKQLTFQQAPCKENPIVAVKFDTTFAYFHSLPMLNVQLLMDTTTYNSGEEPSMA